MDKAAVRLMIRQKKRAMTEPEIQAESAILTERFMRLPEYRRASVLYGYISYNQEVRTRAILEQAFRDGKRVAVPRIRDGKMEFLYIQNLDDLKPGYGGIPEPVAGEIATEKTALVLVPGLAFDKHGHRIGYGGGFYDRFLAAEPEHSTVALCYAFQVLPHLNTEETDIPVDLVISSGG